MLYDSKNSIIETLSSELTVEKVIIQKGLYDGAIKKIINLAKDKKIRIDYAEKPVLDRLSRQHQGAIMFATEYKYFDLEEILQGTSPLLVVVLDSITDPHNLGSVIRVAECAGASGIIIPKRNSATVNDTVMRISAGAASHVKVAQVNNINDAIRKLKDRGIKVLATDASGDSVYNEDLLSDIAFVIGSEGEGLHKLTRELSDKTVSLPQFGKINSLNASVATGIFLYEAARQRFIK